MNVQTVRRLLKISKQTTTIERRVEAAEDAYGNVTHAAYTTLAEGVLCQVSPVKLRGETYTENTQLILNLHEFYFAADEDITEDDRLRGITFKGVLVNDHRFEIIEILREEWYYRLVRAREVI